MALGNIQWRFQEPVDFATGIRAENNKNSEFWSNLGANIGTAARDIHDYNLDKELADMIEGNDIAAIEAEEKQLNSRLVELQNELVSLGGV